MHRTGGAARRPRDARCVDADAGVGRDRDDGEDGSDCGGGGGGNGPAAADDWGGEDTCAVGAEAADAAPKARDRIFFSAAVDERLNDPTATAEEVLEDGPREDAGANSVCRAVAISP